MPAWKSNYIHYEMWVEMIYPLPNFKGATLEIWEWTRNSILHVAGYVIILPCRDQGQSMLVK